MSYPPIILFDFDGVIITQKSLEYTASKLIKNKFYGWKNIENMRLIDFARLFRNQIRKIDYWHSYDLIKFTNLSSQIFGREIYSL